MFGPPVPLIDPISPTEPHRLVACAVLRQAIEDSRNSRRPAAAAMALGWLHGHGANFWIAATGLDPNIIAERLGRSVRPGR